MELSKEEKEAIEYLNMYADDMENRVYDGDTTWNIKSVLNLISKLQKENEKQPKVIDEMAKEMSCGIYKFDNMKIDKIKQYFYRKVENENV